MTSAQQSWDDLGSQLSALGLKLKLHYEQEHGATDEPAEGIRESVGRLADALEDAFEALGNAVGDDAVRDDARQAGGLLVDAVAATFEEVASELRGAVDRRSAE